MKNILAITIILSGLSYLLKGYEPLSAYCQAGLTFFIPGIGAIFLISYWLSLKFEKIIDQPPLMIFILSIVIKMLSSLTLFLVYLMKSFGPANEGALVFIITYLIFEFLEIKRFLSILRPDSRENTPE